MFEIFMMSPSDIPEALALWERTPGISLTEADHPDRLRQFLERNPGTNFVARGHGRLLGVAMAGYDGRRGYLHHVAVAEDARRQGIGRAIVERCLQALHDLGIGKCHLFVQVGNDSGAAFWKHLGWQPRIDLQMMSFSLVGSPPPE